MLGLEYICLRQFHQNQSLMRNEMESKYGGEYSKTQIEVREGLVHKRSGTKSG